MTAQGISSLIFFWCNQEEHSSHYSFSLHCMFTKIRSASASRIGCSWHPCYGQATRLLEYILNVSYFNNAMKNTFLIKAIAKIFFNTYLKYKTDKIINTCSYGVSLKFGLELGSLCNSPSLPSFYSFTPYSTILLFFLPLLYHPFILSPPTLPSFYSFSPYSTILLFFLFPLYHPFILPPPTLPSFYSSSPHSTILLFFLPPLYHPFILSPPTLPSFYSFSPYSTILLTFPHLLFMKFSRLCGNDVYSRLWCVMICEPVKKV